MGDQLVCIMFRYKEASLTMDANRFSDGAFCACMRRWFDLE